MIFIFAGLLIGVMLAFTVIYESKAHDDDEDIHTENRK